jgi:hypothetical protein
LLPEPRLSHIFFREPEFTRRAASPTLGRSLRNKKAGVTPAFPKSGSKRDQ